MSDSTATNNTSTVKAAIDSVTGTAQQMLGQVMGSTGDESKGQMRQEKAHAENEASHATAKIPGFTASGEGAVTKDSDDRTKGQWNQTMGSAKETIGGLTGSEVCYFVPSPTLQPPVAKGQAANMEGYDKQNLKAEGRKQNLEGQHQEAKGQVTDYASGVGNRVQGTVGSAVAGLTGDKDGQKHYEKLHAEGKTTQRGAEYDLQKQAEAERASRME
jgi:uncharacterized protein YjbJ (UPF0337 family)